MPNKYPGKIWGGKGKQRKRRRGVSRAASVLEAIEYGLQFRPTQRDEPTGAMPGSTERVNVYIRRINEGLELFHPLDANFFDD